uniref:Uncharacterized protein n=1 Tax=Escherichia coli TaxID=562 RepID=A0A7L7TGK0_ECOLX|nr:hypothetical protein [Escherichia coli]UFD95472.1 Microsomal dipeptidase [Escherichia coli]
MILIWFTVAKIWGEFKHEVRQFQKPYDNQEPRQPGGCKLKTAPVRPVVAARPAEYVCSEDLFY